MKIIFYLSVTTLIYIYLGYLIFAIFTSFVLNRKVKKSPYEPTVTILISAFNEEKHIDKTIRNKLSMEYPKEKLQIIVVSDGSTDNTDQIVRSYDNEAVQLIRQEPRAGKTSALQLAIPHAIGEILVFSDANSIYATDSIKKLVQNFADLSVGYVTGKMIYNNSGSSSVGDGCTGYMRYENFLRKHETRSGSIVGVDGGIDAIRKTLFRKMRDDQLPDLVLPLRVIEQGYRVVYEPEAVLKEDALNNAGDEYRMRVRVALRAFWAISDMRHLLNIRKYGLFAFQLWSHKLLRYLSFLFLILAYFSNFFIRNQGFWWQSIFIIQNLAYMLALLSYILEKYSLRLRVLSMLQYFLIINITSAHAFLKFLLGKKQVFWTPRKG